MPHPWSASCFVNYPDIKRGRERGRRSLRAGEEKKEGESVEVASGKLIRRGVVVGFPFARRSGLLSAVVIRHVERHEREARPRRVPRGIVEQLLQELGRRHSTAISATLETQGSVPVFTLASHASLSVSNHKWRSRVAYSAKFPRHLYSLLPRLFLSFFHTGY